MWTRELHGNGLLEGCLSIATRTATRHRVPLFRRDLRDTLRAVTRLLSTDDLFARLVAFDTTSRNSNLPLVDFLSGYLDRPNISLLRNASADETKANLLVTVGPPSDPETRDGLTLSGHTDVVPAEEPEWNSDPFALTDGGDRWIGRGACDMKGFVALAVNRAVRLAERPPTRPLVLLFTYDEEVGTLGARRFVETFEGASTLPRRTIIGEPTALRAVRMHKGHLKLRIIFHGVPAHSGYPHLGKNAIEPAGAAIVALTALRAELEREGGPNADAFPEVPYVALNVAMVHGGVATNIVPDRCTVDVGLRVLPGMRGADLVDRVRAALSAALGAERFELEVSGESPPLLLDAASDVHRAVCSEIDQRASLSVSFATDAGWFQSAGLECVIFGPGSIEVAHKPNESVPKGDLARADAVLERLVERYCVA